MNIVKALIGFCAVGALASHPLQAQAADTVMRLSLSDVIGMAHTNNYLIKAAKSRVDQAEARVLQTRQSSLPKVMLSETLMITNDPGAALVFKLQQKSLQNSDFEASKMTHPDVINDFNTSLQVMQPVFNADASPGRSMAITAKNAEVYMAKRSGETIGLQVSKLYYGLILARKNLEAVEYSITIMQGYSAEAARGYNAKMLTKSDKLSTEVRLAELHEQKLLFLDEIRNAGDMLKVMLKLEAGVTIVPTGDLSVDAAVPQGDANSVPPDRTDLKAFELYRDAAALQGEMINASKLPRLNAFMQTNLHSNNIFGGGASWAVGINMQWNIYDGMATDGRTQEAKAREREAMYNVDAARSNSIAEVNRSLRSLKTAKARIAVASKSMDAAKISLDYIGKQYKSGMAMTFELLMREQAYSYSILRLNQAAYDYCIAKSELEYYNGGSY